MDDYREVAHLCGGYVCRLNCAERNAWYKHITVLPAFKKFRMAGLLLDIAKTRVVSETETTDKGLAELSQRLDDMVEADAAMFLEGEKWFKSLPQVDRRNPPLSDLKRHLDKFKEETKECPKQEEK